MSYGIISDLTIRNVITATVTKNVMTVSLCVELKTFIVNLKIIHLIQLFVYI